MAEEKKECDIYEQFLEGLEIFYGEIPNRMFFRKTIKGILTPDDCAVWLLFPTHEQTPVFLEEIKEKNADNIKNIDAIMEKLIRLYFLDNWDTKDGEKRYVRNYLFQIAITYSKVTGTDDPMRIACSDWFNCQLLGCSKNLPYDISEFRVISNEGALTGIPESGEIPMDMEIPDTREIVPFDYVTKMIRERRTICQTPCFCRKIKQNMGSKKCDYPIETCLLFDDLAERTLGYGGGKKLTADEAIALTKRGSEMGLVHSISNAEKPSVLCQCCSCCCLILGSMLRGETTCGKPSRFSVRIDEKKCIGCEKCNSVCPAKAIEFSDGHLHYNLEKCFGCGICAVNCKSGALSMQPRKNAKELLPDAEHLDVLYI